VKQIKKLSKKELYFCRYYLETGNSKEAAILAGFLKHPENVGSELLSRPEICQKIDSLYNSKKKNFIYRAVIGYERLAFGNISDAIKLLFLEKFTIDDIEKMNLFNISEIKKPKDGAIEIKFFDRIRALEKLEQIDSENSDKEKPFYYALENSIKNINLNNNSESF